MSSGQTDNNQQQNGPSAEEFWAEENERAKALDELLRENKMGGYDPKYAGLDTDDEDEDDESDDTDDDGDATRPDEDSKRKDLPS
jgi:hypothetical protein